MSPYQGKKKTWRIARFSNRFFSFGYRSSRNVNLTNRSGRYPPRDLQHFTDSILVSQGRMNRPGFCGGSNL
jgi:hypothetical protein